MKYSDVRKIRDNLGLSQVQMADRIGISQSTVSRLERGIQEPDGPILKLLEIIRAEASQ